MNAVFNKVLVNVLGKYLQYYMNDFSKDSFKLQIIKGTFDLEDIEINCQFLKDTVVLPNLEITDCLCDRVGIYIPWHNISKEPIVIDLDTITMTLVEIPIGEQPIFQPRKKRVKPTSYGFIQRTLDGIQMSVKQVNMTVKLNGYRGNPYMAKIGTSNIKIYSAGPDWQPVDLKESFVSDKTRSEVLFYKVLECGSMEFSFADLSPNRKNPDQPPEYATIMKDVPVKIRCKVLKDASDGHVVCGAFDLVIDKMDMNFTDSQWKGFMELIKSLIGCFTRTDQEYSFYRDVGKAFEEVEEPEFDDMGNEIRDKKLPPKSKSWWSGWTESLSEKKVQKDKDKAEKDRIKRIQINEQKMKSGILAEMQDTTFNVLIGHGTMNMLNEEDYCTEDPAFDAFGRLHFEHMKVIITLPPAMDVPSTNKWAADDPNKRLLCEARLEMRNMALVLQEDMKNISESEMGTRERKQAILVTDGRSDTLKAKVTKEKKRKKKKSKKKKRSSISNNTTAVVNEKEGNDDDDDNENKKNKEKQNKYDDDDNIKTEGEQRNGGGGKEEEEEEEGEKKQKKKKSKRKSGGSSSAAKDKMRPFCLVDWHVTTIAPQESDMTKWLKSLRCKMNIDVYQSHLLLLHRWWSRVVSFLETTSVGSDNIQAVNLLRMYSELNVTENIMIVPMTGGNELIVHDMTEIMASPHLRLYSTAVRGGKAMLPDYVSDLFKQKKINDLLNLNDNNDEIMEKKKLKIVGLGEDKENGWQSLHLLRKPQRFQVLFENMSLSINDTRILNPVDFGFEITLHRYKDFGQQLLEFCVHTQALQLTLSRSHYLMLLHFNKFVIAELWEEIIKVLLRKYGDNSIQKELAVLTYLNVARSIGEMPMVVHTRAFFEHFLIHINGQKAPKAIAYLDQFDDFEGSDKAMNPEGESILELHMEGLKTLSCDVDRFTTNIYDKKITMEKVVAMAPPDNERRKQVINKKGGENASWGADGKGATSRLHINHVSGSVASAQLPVISSTLTQNNQKALTRLVEEGIGEEARDVSETEESSHGADVMTMELKVDDEIATHLPNVLVAFLNDLFNL